MTERWHMMKITLHRRDLCPMLKRQVFSRAAIDLDYLVHSALGELFGEESPAPFVVRNEQNGNIQILAYSDVSGEQLRQLVRENVPLNLREAINRKDAIVSRQMPDRFPEGVRFHFRVRICPVVRKARGGGEKAGREQDVFLAAVEHKGKDTGLDRETVYCEWFAAQVEKRGGARYGGLRIVEMRLHSAVRRDRDRNAQNLIRPEAVIEGTLTVNDSSVFADFIRRGFGRHKAFGFGMILLKPAE